MSLFFLCCFAFLAGFVDAMVGGGGLVQLPAFFIFQPQLSLVQTLATNKTASFCGTAVSTVHYLKTVKIDWKKLAPAIGTAFVGALCGALLVSYVRKEQFMPFIITALVAVLLYTLKKKQLGMAEKEKLTPSRHLAYSLTAGLLIGGYDGLIGPGTGSFLVFVFVSLFGYTFLYAAANAKVINCVTNISALIFFLLKGSIVWSIALPVAGANMLGNYIGTKLALRRGSSFIRIFFIIVVSLLIAKLSWDYFLKGCGR